MSFSYQKQQSSSKPLAQAWRKLLDIPFVYPLLILLVFVILLEKPGMFKPLFFFTILRQAMPLVLVTLGQSLCMRVRSIDLSSTGVIVVSVYILTSGIVNAPVWVLCFLAIGFGFLVGVVNAWFIGVRRSSAVLVTLATAMISTGFVLILSSISQPGPTPASLVAFAKWRVLGVPFLPIFVLLLVGLMAWALRKSVLVRVIDAIGANPKAAWTSGLPYLKTIYAVHILSAVLAALAGIVMAASLGKGSVTAGADLALFSLAAVVLGGVSFGVSKGGVLGPVLAACMMTFLFNFLTAYGIQQPARLVVVGVIIVISAVLMNWRQTH